MKILLGIVIVGLLSYAAERGDQGNKPAAVFVMLFMSGLGAALLGFLW